MSTKDNINNARLNLMMSGYCAVIDIQDVPNCDKIARGNLIPASNMVPPPGMRAGMESDNNENEIFFSRDYQPEVNDSDQVYTEIEIGDESVLGIPFTLIPKHKVLFGYEPASTIIKPTIKFHNPGQ